MEIAKQNLFTDWDCSDIPLGIYVQNVFLAKQEIYLADNGENRKSRNVIYHKENWIQ